MNGDATHASRPGIIHQHQELLMNKLLAFVLALAGTLALAQTPTQRLRGTVQSFEAAP